MVFVWDISETYSYRFRGLIKDPTCFENSENLSCIDVTLTSNPYSVQNSSVIETGLSNFQKMIVTVKKATYQKLKPKIVLYKDYIKFSEDVFRKKCLINQWKTLVLHCRRYRNFI